MQVNTSTSQCYCHEKIFHNVLVKLNRIQNSNTKKCLNAKPPLWNEKIVQSALTTLAADHSLNKLSLAMINLYLLST